MTTQSTTDGGYYAIKGFEYQIDKAILDILDSEDENKKINIEQIQDIDSDSFVIQVKYRETQGFTPAKIKSPIIQLIKEFKEDKTKNYILYAFFGNLNGYEEFADTNKKITISKLDKVLGNQNINCTDLDKKEFIDNFYLDFSPDFQKQFDDVILKLKNEAIFGDNEDEIIFFYSNITDFLRKLIANNSPLKKENRTTSKKEIFDYLKSSKKLIFTTAYREYLGSIKYFTFIKKKFISPSKNKENFILLGEIQVDNSVKLDNLVLDITNNYFKKATHDIKPLTFIISDKIVADVKISFIDNKINFNDGYEAIKFNSDLFSESPIINKKIVGSHKATDSLDKISFKVRIISYSNFIKIQDYGIIPQMIYYFDTELINHFENISHIKIDNLDSNKIKQLFK